MPRTLYFLCLARGLISASTPLIVIVPIVTSGRVVLYPSPGPAAVDVCIGSPYTRPRILASFSLTEQ